MTRCKTRIAMNLVVWLLIFVKISAATMDMNMYRSITSFKECLGKKHAGVCFKEKALDALNETIMSDKPITFYGMVDIEKNPNFHLNNTEEANQLPEDVTARSMKLSHILYDKVEEFFKSRVVKFSMAPTFDDEGRAKKDKGKGSMMMLAMGGMACMIAQVFMGKIAFMAGTALIVAKVALFLSAIIGLKKLAGGSGGGGETSHVVYASSGDYGHSHGGGGGGGGWHRSLDADSNQLAYRAHASEENYGI